MMLQRSRTHVHGPGKVIAKAALVAAAGILVPGCVQLSAPEKPIEINLNINIRQEVLVKLERDVQELIEKNPGVF